MSNQQRRYDNNFERDYYHRIYNRNNIYSIYEDEVESDQSRYATAAFNSLLNNRSYRRLLTQSTTESYSSRRSGESSSDNYTHDAETESILSSFRRLGIESASLQSIMNLRNNSYLKSLEDDCIETLLMKMQPKEEKKDDKDKKPDDQAVVKAETEAPKVEEEVKKLTCSQKIKTKFTSFISLFSWDNLGKILKPIDFQSDLYLVWLSIVSIFYIYNIFAISIRFSFEFDREVITDEIVNLENEDFSESYDEFILGNGTNLTDFNFTLKNSTLNNNSTLFIRNKVASFFIAIIKKRLYWFMFDYLSDLIYLVDIFLIQTRIKFLKEGLWISDLKSTSLNYFKSWKFYVIYNFRIKYFLYWIYRKYKHFS